MKRVLVFIVGVFCICAQINAQQRITGGEDINIIEVPWQVLIKWGGEYQCGGSIISSEYILTAKHCAENLEPNSIQVIAGVTCKNEVNSNNTHSVSSIILHPTLDVALLKLSSPLTFTNKIQPIDYLNAVNTSCYEVANNVRVSGWGWLTSNGYNAASCLQAVNVHIISNNEANQMLNDLGQSVTNDEIATTGIGSVRQGACHGDSGGPLTFWSSSLQKHILIGIVSWGRGGCVGDNGNSPSVYIRTSNIIGWILSSIHSISGTNSVCSLADFSILDLPLGFSVNWTCNNSNLTIVSGQGSSNATFQKTGNGRVDMNANISFNGVSIATLSKSNISVGIPERPGSSIENFFNPSYNASADYEICNGNATVRNNIYFSQSTTSAMADEWIVDITSGDNLFVLAQNQNYVTVILKNPLATGGGSFTVKSKNSCGMGSAQTVYLTFKNCTQTFGLTPNPATNVTTLYLQENDLLFNSVHGSSYDVEEYTVQIWSEKLGLVKKMTGNRSVIQIPLDGLSAGFYYVHLLKDGKMYKKTLIIK